MQNSPFLEAIKEKVFFNKLGRESCQMQSLGTTLCWAMGHSPRAWIWALEMQDGLEEGAALGWQGRPLLSKNHIYLYSQTA